MFPEDLWRRAQIGDILAQRFNAELYRKQFWRNSFGATIIEINATKWNFVNLNIHYLNPPRVLNRSLNNS